MASANPNKSDADLEHMRAALALLGQAAIGTHGRRIAVLGDMLELGPRADEWHRELLEPVIATKIEAPAMEKAIDFILGFQDAETGEQIWVDTNDRGFRRRFLAAAEQEQESLRASFAKAGIDCLELSTEDDLLDAIVRFVQLRRQRAKGALGGVVPAHVNAHLSTHPASHQRVAR